MGNRLTDVLEERGFTLRTAMQTKDGSKGVFDNLYSVVHDNKEIAYLRKNEDGTYNTLEFLRYPSSYPSVMKNVKQDTVVNMLQSVKRNNFN